ncbi:hypothetical protein Poli38472_007020 [Pythium oligandrum]|uniref:Uncharacterized protein n=1 Tax=Pythium oligandrum TaxID=41045 RepID=A0A8K1FCZ1_PYTOL|nr:hypothetical protein Poli38472_007020 [Pythium oligandrum]|eukprot:TMW58875.1 hypothetical protein Poli38472_007020 [Pythium oligandrum]
MPVSGAWVHQNCHHEQIFRSEYRRSNHRQGVKILRCFPHCCPTHVERSYCGSPLHLAVGVDSSLSHVDVRRLSVIARFEFDQCDDGLSAGVQYSMRDLLDQNHPSTPWFHGVLLSSSDASTRIFRINDEPSTKWFYHWESGATKSQRFTKHVLCAYVLLGQEVNDTVEVLGVVRSPAFTLVSHRRSIPTEGSVTEASAPVDVLHRMVRSRISQAFEQYQANKRHSTFSDDENSDFVLSESSEQASGGNQRDRQLYLMASLKDLAIIFRFVSSVSIFDAMPSFCVREHVFASMREHWTSSSRSKMAITVLGTVMALRTSAQPLRSAFSSSMDELFITVLKLIVWIVCDANVSWLRQFFDAHADDVTDPTRLEVTFMLWVEEFFARLDGFWQQTFAGSASRVNSIAAFRDLSDRIVALVHPDSRFCALWPAMRVILESSGVLMWKPFTAQLQESYTRKQVHQFVPLSSSRAARVTGEWDLDSSSFNICRLSISAQNENLSAKNVLLGAARLLRWRVSVRDDNALLIQCENSLLPVESAWMSLICDDTVRATSVLPLGLVWRGDYRGRVTRPGSNYELEFFFRYKTTASHRLVVSLAHESSTDSLSVVVECHHADFASLEHTREEWAPVWRVDARLHRRRE